MRKIYKTIIFSILLLNFFVLHSASGRAGLEIITINNSLQTFSAQIISSQDVFCKGDSTGSATVEANGGSGIYTYFWNTTPIQTTPTATGLMAGIYQVEVYDAGEIDPIILSVTINEPSEELSAELISLTNVRCYGDTNAAIAVTGIGGSGDYNYLWNTNPPQFSSNATGLGAGNYSVIIKDNNGCSKEILLHATITQPAKITAVASITPSVCGESNGSISLDVNGGTNPYKFNWNTGNNSQNINNLNSGTYYVSITDDNYCWFSLWIKVDEISPMKVTSEIKEVSCYGKADGAIEVAVEKGTEPYSFVWNTGGTNPKVENLPAGTYSVEVTDNNNCKSLREFKISEADEMIVNLYPSIYKSKFNISTYNGNDGYLSAEISGGTPPYVLDWSNGEKNSEIKDLPAGEYSVEIKDANGCTMVASAKLIAPERLNFPNGITPNWDGKNDNFVIQGIEDYPENIITIYNRWGNVVFSKENYMNDWKGINMDQEELPSGTYYYILTVDQRDTVFKGFIDLRR